MKQDAGFAGMKRPRGRPVALRGESSRQENSRTGENGRVQVTGNGAAGAAVASPAVCGVAFIPNLSIAAPPLPDRGVQTAGICRPGVAASPVSGAVSCLRSPAIVARALLRCNRPQRE